MGTIADLAEGASKGLFSGMGKLAKDIRVAITGIDPEKQAELEEKLLELEAASENAQAQINLAEAANPRLFISGWRPACGWVCVFAFLYNFILTPFIQTILLIVGTAIKLPVLDISVMLPVLLGMLGLGGLRSFEKKNGIEAR